MICENCEREELEWCAEANDGDGGYLCPLWKNYSYGVGCFQALSAKDFNKKTRASRAVDEEKENQEPQLKDGDRKAENVAALLRGDLIVRRQPLLPRVLSVSNAAAVVRGPFKSPCPGANSEKTAELLRRLNARRRFVPWGSERDSISPPTQILVPQPPCLPLEEDKLSEFPPGIEPLVLWEPEDYTGEDGKLSSISVDPRLVRFLRPHQREGVQFMFECVAGLREFSKMNQGLMGCILADDMGLGKTLQSITLLWTLLKQGFDGIPIAKRALIVTPTSLVSNWESEIHKWLGSKVPVMALCESTRSDVIAGIASYLAPHGLFQVMIISYETFRMHAEKFQHPGSCDLLICDEAHRLKNDQTRTNKALAGLQCQRRVLLSGTPMQNDLEEFYAMVNFTNPGILGNPTTFRRYYEAPILIGREPTATEEERIRGSERSAELSEKVNQFILRRTNALLSNHLPPKIVEIVCCKLTDVQENLYQHFIHSKNVRQVLKDSTKRARVLSSILALKKLCNHPKLIYDTVRSGNSEAAGFENCLQYFPPEFCFGRKGSWGGAHGTWVELSGKMSVLARLLENLRQKTNDRIVLVSNYTQTLDLFVRLCRERNYPYVKLDGTTSISKRQKLVQRFNDPTQNEFAFLLSSKAGGCGLNLIGGNRLVLFDPDWNPANDKQAAARVWRDGQKKRVYIYRFLSAGTIEEKVFERQLSKEGLQKVVEQQQLDDSRHSQASWLSSEDLRDLFSLHENVRSDIHDNLNCKRCIEAGDKMASELQDAEDGSDVGLDIGDFAQVAGCLDMQRQWEKQVGIPLEEDLKHWAHHSDVRTVPDVILQAAAGNEVTFVFSCQIDGKVIPVESMKNEQKDLNQQSLFSRRPLLSKENRFSVPIDKDKSTPLLDATNSVQNNHGIAKKVLPAKRNSVIEDVDDEFM